MEKQKDTFILVEMTMLATDTEFGGREWKEYVIKARKNDMKLNPCW